jgi:LCP family protein required for cell wall assembly
MSVYSGTGGEPPKPKTRRRRWVRVTLWSAGVLTVLVVAAGAAAYWWIEEQYNAITNVDKSVSRARHDLAPTVANLPLASQPATILVIGSDHRYTDGTAPPRSDTLMLVHIDPKHKLISLLSIPRDLYVDVPGLGMNKINSAFSQGRNGADLALRTVEEVTHVHPQYLAVVNFAGFKKLVNDLGGVYIPVDENYQHSNAGQPPSNIYSEIHIDPGYQKLSGANALAFARFRHTDDDFHRNARQQLFLHQFELAAANRFHGISITDLPTIISVISDVTHNVEFTGRTKPSLGTLKEYLALLYSMHGRIVSTRLKAVQNVNLSDGAAVVEDAPSDITKTVYAFEHPWKVGQPGGQIPRQRRPHTKKFKPTQDPRSVKVTVLNGTTRAHLAAKVANGLGAWGYRTTDRNAPGSSFRHSWIFYTPGFENAARDLRKIVGVGVVYQQSATFARRAHLKGDVAVVLGPDYSGKLAIKVPHVAAPKLPSDMTATQDYLSEFRAAARAAHLPGLYPTAIPTASNGALVPFSYPSEPIRYYNIPAAGKGPNSMYAYFQWNGQPGSYWGIEETRFVDAPILQNPSAVRNINGRRFQYYFNGSHIQMVAIIDNVHNVVYWVQNTLLNELSNPDMIAIARSLAPTR